jgi:hypothetical protein
MEIGSHRRKAERSGGDALIRQAISCDICASEKKLTNHWFVAHDLNGELRVTGWNSRNRLRPGSKHLCGQTCLHKLLDEFISRTIEVKGQAAGVEDTILHPTMMATNAETDASLTEDAAYEAVESSARLVEPGEAVLPSMLPKPMIAKPVAPVRTPSGPVAVPGRMAAEELPPPNEMPHYASRNLRAEAWDRERERELRAVERRPEASSRRRSGS